MATFNQEGQTVGVQVNIGSGDGMKRMLWVIESDGLFRLYLSRVEAEPEPTDRYGPDYWGYRDPRNQQVFGRMNVHVFETAADAGRVATSDLRRKRDMIDRSLEDISRQVHDAAGQ
jgi:hypothetical protein